MAALIPSILSLIQNIGKEDGCYNVTEGNTTQLVPKPFKPVYSVSVYFLLMFILLSISTTSFSVLHFSALGKRERKRAHVLSSKADAQEKSLEMDEKMSESKELPSEGMVGTTNHKFEKTVLLSIASMIAFTCYGVLPGFQSYSVTRAAFIYSVCSFPFDLCQLESFGLFIGATIRPAGV